MANLDFPNFLDYLEFCQEVPKCSLLWPELGGLAGEINDLAYFTIRSLLTLYLLPTFNESWRGYSHHGKAAFAVTYLFFYSHYHSQFTKVASYIDSQAIRGDKASQGLDHLRTAYYACTPLYEDVRGVIKAGTTLRIVQAAERQSQYGPFLLFWAQFDDPRYTETPIEIASIMLDFWCDNEWPPKPNPKYLEWVERPAGVEN